MKKNPLSELNFINRMFVYLRREGTTNQQALQLLEDRLPDRYRNTLDEMSEFINPGEESGKPLSKYSNFMLHDLREHIKGDDERVVLSAFEALARVSPGLAMCSRFFSALYLYPLAITGIAMMVYAIYKMFVYPQFLQIYEVQYLPELTRWVFSDIVGVLIACFIVVIGVFGALNIGTLVTSFRTFKPDTSIFGKVLGVSEHHAYLIFLAYIKAMLMCDSAPKESHERAFQYARLNKINTPSYKDNQLGLDMLKERDEHLFEEEVDYQTLEVVGQLEGALVARQEVVLFGFQVAIFVFIGVLITAMYLPLFKMASVF